MMKAKELPYDEGDRSLRPSSRNLLAHDPSGGVENARYFARPLPLSNSSSLEVCKQQHSSDLHDPLSDGGDDDREESVDLGPPSASLDFVPKRRGVEIFVGGLTRSTRRDVLRDWFQHAGEVTEVRIARDKRRRRCRGYGFVRFATSEQANWAIRTMHRFEFKHGRFLSVLPSDENRTLFLAGLREEWSCEYICQLLKEKMPGFRKVEPIPDRADRSKIRNFCFLELASHVEAALLFNRHHTTPRPPVLPAQQTTTPSSRAPPGLASLELLLPPSACAAGGGGDGGDGAGVFFERNTRDGRGDAGDGEEAGTGTGGTVPLVVGGATLTVDWADPLRYHIHLNNGMSGPSTSPGFGMPRDGRPCSRGGGDGGLPGERLPQPGSVAPRNVRAVGGCFCVDSHLQRQRRGAHEQQALVCHTSSLLSNPRWQGGGHHSARMAQGLQHEGGQQQRRLDVSRGRRPYNLSHNGGVLRVPTRERGYTVAAGYTASRRSPFDADVDGGGGVGGNGGRSVASQQHSGYDDRPRSMSSSHFHASKQQDYVDARIAIPSVHHREHDRQERLRPHPTLAGGSAESQFLHPGMGATVSDVVSVSAGGHGGIHEGHHHPLGAASECIPTGRPYSAAADISAGRHGRREAFSVSYNGDDDGDGDGNGNNMPPSMSYSLGSLDWPGCRREDLMAAVPQFRGLGQRHRSSASLHGGHLSGATSVDDGHRSQRQQQHQRWEQPGFRDRAKDIYAKMEKNRASPPLDGVGGRDSSYNHHYIADFATFDRQFEQQQQQPQQQRPEQRPERFSNTASAALQPHARRHTVREGLDLNLGISGGQDNGGNPPPGFSASRAVDTWGAPPLLPHAGSGATAAAEDGSAGMHLGAGLRDSMGARGLDCPGRSSWSSVLLSPEATGCGDQSWGL